MQGSTRCDPTTVGSDVVLAYYNGSAWIDLECTSGIDFDSDGVTEILEPLVIVGGSIIRIDGDDDGLPEVGFGGNLFGWGTIYFWDEAMTDIATDWGGYIQTGCSNDGSGTEDCDYSFASKVNGVDANFMTLNADAGSGGNGLLVLGTGPGIDEIRVDIDIDMNGNDILDSGAITLTAADLTLTAGSLFMIGNGEVLAVDAGSAALPSIYADAASTTGLHWASGNPSISHGGATQFAVTASDVDIFDVLHMNDEGITEVAGVTFTITSTPVLPLSNGRITMDTDLYPGGNMATIGDGTEANPIRACSIQSAGPANKATNSTHYIHTGQLFYAGAQYPSRPAPVTHTVSHFRCWTEDDAPDTESITLTIQTAADSGFPAASDTGVNQGNWLNSSISCAITGDGTAPHDEMSCSDSDTLVVSAEDHMRIKAVSSASRGAEIVACSWVECIDSF